MSELRRLLGYARPYRARFWMAVVASGMVAIFNGALPLLVKPLVDRDLASGSTDAPIELPLLGPIDLTIPAGMPVAALILVAFVGKGLFTYASRYLMSWVSERAIVDLRSDLGAALAHKSIGFFAEASTGDLIARMASDPEKILLALGEKLYDLIRETLTMLVLAAVLIAIDWQLALASLVLAPVLIVPVSRVGRKLRRASESGQRAIAELSSRVHELVRGIRVVKAAAAEELEAGRIRAAAREIFAAHMRAVKVVALTPPLMEMLAGVGIAAAFSYGRLRIAAGVMTTGDFLAFMAALVALYTPVKKLTRVQAAFEQAIAAGQRCFAVIDAPVRIVESADARPLERVEGEVRFENVSFRYEENEVLSDLDFEIPAGAVVALVGHSGAGKSTIANLLLRFYDPTSGRVTIDGHDLRDVEIASLRRQIGLVPQDVVLFNDTLRANIAFGLGQVAEPQLEAAADAAYALDFIREQPRGWDEIVGEGGVRLSTGQRQRVAIARALLQDRPLLVLDEATSALDSESEALVTRALENLMRDRTTVVIAHRLSTVRRADRILVLDRGRLLEAGTHEELLRKEGGLYTRLAELQASGELSG